MKHVLVVGIRPENAEMLSTGIVGVKPNFDGYITFRFTYFEKYGGIVLQSDGRDAILLPIAVQIFSRIVDREC